MDYFQMTSPCGIDCFNCPLYAAKKNQDLRSMIAENLGIPPEMAQCSGCRAQKGEMPFLGWSEPCPQFTCVTEKGHGFCHECYDFPCEWLHPSAFRAESVPHNYKLYNLLRIKKVGLEKWAAQEASAIRDNYFTGEHPILQKAGKSMKK
jgi:recombinational DNA repair protein (RecF pathway)